MSTENNRWNNLACAWITGTFWGFERTTSGPQKDHLWRRACIMDDNSGYSWSTWTFTSGVNSRQQSPWNIFLRPKYFKLYFCIYNFSCFQTSQQWSADTLKWRSTGGRRMPRNVWLKKTTSVPTCWDCMHSNIVQSRKTHNAPSALWLMCLPISDSRKNCTHFGGRCVFYP